MLEMVVKMKIGRDKTEFMIRCWKNVNELASHGLKKSGGEICVSALSEIRSGGDTCPV
jgi:hypothetical protein